MNVRASAAGFKQAFINFIADPQWIIPSIIAPFIFTIVALMIYNDSSGPVVLQAVLGGGVLGMWGNTLYSSGWSISYDRYNGTLEPLMISPTHMMDVIAGRAVWHTIIGLSNAVLVFVVAEIMFETSLTLENPVLFFLVLVITLFSLAAIGLIFSAFFVLTRTSSVLMSSLEFPIYVVSGALFPVSILPAWASWISLGLAPSWGVEAMRSVAFGGFVTSDLLTDVGMMVLLIAIYLVLAAGLFRKIERNVRNHGSMGRF
ncbi:MAG: ABC transporter permease [Candidatus Methanomethylophilaceae archaeon]